MKITKETISKLNELGYNVWADDLYGLIDMDDYKNATHIGIGTKKDFDVWFCKVFKVPKEKEVTVGWLLAKINKENRYKSLYEYFQKIVDEKSISVYPTSYGIGVSSLFDRRKDIETVSNRLHSLGLKFRSELSEGGWVYRFIVSKDSENMRILESLKSA